MSDPKVQNMAKTFLEHGITKMFDTALKAMGVDLKKGGKAYYKASRLVFKALMAASAQKLLEDGANRALLRDTYSPEDAWVLFLDRHPDIAKKLAPPQPKPPPKPKTQLKVIEGGKVPDAPLLECASGCHGVFNTVEEWQNHKCEAAEACDCSCHDHPVPGGCGNCECISEVNGDEVL